MTSPERNNIFVIGPKKDAIKSVSIKSLQAELKEIQQHKEKGMIEGIPYPYYEKIQAHL